MKTNKIEDRKLKAKINAIGMCDKLGMQIEFDEYNQLIIYSNLIRCEEFTNGSYRLREYEDGDFDV